ncbi:MAG: hypothetical protein OXI16_07245 [Chloroflexota bacterium]|nr:hypothetical protein [Chloroflexota bacterium]MDE2687275.1 hypothetical protein [Chloroflexota bacterium]MYC08329.1 hypothetical protein [Chloroflexota bacterium]
MNDSEITYRPHFRLRMRQREFPDGFGEMLLRDADNYYYDTQENTSVAVKRVPFKGRERDIALIFSVEGSAIAFISIFPLKLGELRRKTQMGKWARDETASNL